MTDILIVDDHPVVAEGIRRILLLKGIASGCSTVSSCKECYDYLHLFTPDLVILDYNLPDGNGLELCRYIIKNNRNTKVLAISSFRELGLLKAMLESGASGYIIKNASEDEILEAVESVLTGKVYLDEESRILFNEKESQTILTAREIEILKLIADGYTNPEVAERLFISPLTVERHRKNIIAKLNAKNTASLIKIAARKGFI